MQNLWQQNEKPNFLSIFTIYCVALLDSIGFAILLPLITLLIYDARYTILAADTNHLVRSLWYGASMSVHCILMCVATLILPTLSDQYGRKPLLQFCIFGIAVGSFITGWGVYIENIYVLFFGRIIVSLTAANITLTKAILIDLFPSTRDIKLGYLLGILMLGYTLGPPIGSFLLSIINIIAPFGFVTLFAIFNFTLVYFFLNETNKFSLQKKNNWKKIKTFLKKTNIIYLIIITIFYTFSWSSYIFFSPLILTFLFHQTPSAIALFLSMIAIITMISMLFINRLLLTFFTKKTIFLITSALFTPIYFLFIYIKDMRIIWLLNIPATMTLVVAYAMIMGLFSAEVSAKKQGMMMGLHSALTALASGIAVIFFSFITSLSVKSIIVVGAVSMFFSLSLAWYAWHLSS